MPQLSKAWVVAIVLLLFVAFIVWSAHIIIHGATLILGLAVVGVVLFVLLR